MRYTLEDKIQIDCVRCFNALYPNEARLLHHSANEGDGNRLRGAKLKQMGVQPGYPDLMLHVARNGYHGLAIEMKTKTGRQQDTQKDMQKHLEEQGYKYVICRSLDQFMTICEDYLWKVDDKYWQTLRTLLK